MRCKKVRRKLSAFLDGELPQEEAARIKQHLACCSNCQREAKELFQTYQLLTAWRAVRASDMLTLKKPFAPLPQRKSLLHAWQPVRWAAVAACVVGLLIGGLFGMSLGRTVTQEPSASFITTQQRYVRLWGMEALEELPPDSIEGVYVTLAGYDRR